MVAQTTRYPYYTGANIFFTLGFIAITVVSVIWLRQGRYLGKILNFLQSRQERRSVQTHVYGSQYLINTDQPSDAKRQGALKIESEGGIAPLHDLLSARTSPGHSPSRVNKPWRRVLGTLLPVCVILSLLSTSLIFMTTLPILPTRRHAHTTSDSASDVFKTPSSKILIYQHTLPTLTYQDLISASINGHKRYANAHGYRHQINNRSYVVDGETQGSTFLNKLYALRDVVEVELGKGEEGCDWIWMTDVDTLIVNPIIPVHHLLPPSISTPTPLMLGNQDKAGFNAGAVLYHIEPALLELINASFTVVAQHLERSSHPSDQYVIHRALIENPHFGTRFYEIPQFWMNPYEDYKEFNVLQYHMVCGLKITEDWRAVVADMEGIWDVAKLVGDGDEVVGVRRMGWSGAAAKMGLSWWRRGGKLNGIEGIGFSGI